MLESLSWTRGVCSSPCFGASSSVFLGPTYKGGGLENGVVETWGKLWDTKYPLLVKDLGKMRRCKEVEVALCISCDDKRCNVLNSNVVNSCGL